MELREVPYARRDATLAVLENFHAVKHALRFGAHLLGAWTADPEGLAELSASLAPDVHIPAEVVDAESLRAVAPRGQVVAVARRPVQPALGVILAGPDPVVLLENPAHLGNLGAVVRVAAAAGAGGVLTTGRHDPWHPDALRGSAGLHFAVPVLAVPDLHALPGFEDSHPDGTSLSYATSHPHATSLSDATSHPHATSLPDGTSLPHGTGRRELVALDPDGHDIDPGALPARPLLAFGTERHGLSDALLARAHHRIRLPMEPGVSSLNLATAVAATLYGCKLARPAAQRV